MEGYRNFEQKADARTVGAEQDARIRKALEAVIEKRNRQADEKTRTRKRLEEKRDSLEGLRKIPREFMRLDEDGRKELCQDKDREFLERAEGDITKYIGEIGRAHV